MTTYVAIPDSDIDQDSPVTQPLMTALRDNLVAAFEGDATAPSVLPNIGANVQANDIGSYCFATSTVAADVAFGNTIAGSSLETTSAAYGISAGSGTALLSTASVPTGTWRCMGTYDDSAAGGSLGLSGATLWVKIA